MRRLVLGAALALLIVPAAAQSPLPGGPTNQSSLALIAPTAPTAANNDQVATTAWVNNFVNGGLPLAAGKIWIGSAGGIATAQTPSGDWTISQAGVSALATVNANVGTFGSATSCITTTQNAKGLTTAISAATCTPALGSITGFGTGVATALAINIGSAGAPVLFNGAGGTPSSMVGTNITGTAAGLTAGTVTTNANLTGAVTSAGNATSLGSFTSAALAGALTNETGTGVAVFSDSPALTGTPTAPTAAAGTNTTQVATTAGIVAERSATRTTTNETLDTNANTLNLSGSQMTRGQVPGEVSTGSAAVGYIGEYVPSSVASGSAIALTSGVPVNVTSITLGAGDWDITFFGAYIPAATTSFTQCLISISTTTGTLDTTTAFAYNQFSTAANVPAGLTLAFPGGPLRASLSGSTTYFLVTRAIFTVSTMSGYGGIRARRVR